MCLARGSCFDKLGLRDPMFKAILTLSSSKGDAVDSVSLQGRIVFFEKRPHAQ